MKRRQTLGRVALCAGFGVLAPSGTIAVGGSVAGSRAAALVVGVVVAVFVWIISGSS